MSFLEESKTQKWLGIVLSPIFLSMIPFAILWSNYGFYDIYYLFPVIGLIIGVFWAEKARKKGSFEDYSSDALMKIPDMIETWEKENKFEGMTVNERLYLSGKLEQFDNAVKNKNVNLVKSILVDIQITDEDNIEAILDYYNLWGK